METFAAGDIAQRIKRPRESQTAAVARFKNWAKTGLIKQIGARHPGVGKKKRYSGAALLKAVILQVLTDSLGAPASRLGGIAEWMAEHAIDASGRFKDTGDKLIVIGKRLGDRNYFFGFLPPDQLIKYMADQECAVHVVINLSRLLWHSGIETGKGSGIETEKDERE